MKTLKEKADKLAMKYIKEFEKKYELYLEFAVADDYFNVLNFGDYFVNFSDVKYCIDNNVDSELFFNWYNVIIINLLMVFHNYIYYLLDPVH